MRWLKSAALYLLAAGLFCLILNYVGNFSIRQSVVLALLVALLTQGIENRVSKPGRRFSPYYLWVRPNWYDLLIDFKLVDTPEEWHAIEESFAELPPAEYRVLRNGIWFTVVHQSEDFERTLIYKDNHRVFVSEVSFDEEMEPIRVESGSQVEREKGSWRKSDVELFLKFGIDGYDLGIRVPISWWEKARTSCPKPAKEESDHITGQVRLVLATISSREFDLYWEPVQWSSTFHHKTFKQIRARRDEQRMKFGWKEREHPDLPELSINWPESIEHTYFAVEHRAI